MESRRSFLLRAAGTAIAGAVYSHAAPAKSAMPGPYRGRVVEVANPAFIQSGKYNPEEIRRGMRRGMMDLTGAPSWEDAWRGLFARGDVVGIKVSPIGGPTLSSDAAVLHEIIAGLNAAGVRNTSIVVYSRYAEEIRTSGIDKWLPAGVRWTAASPAYTEIQQDMDGYDPDHFIDLALVQPGQDPSLARNRRSYVAKFVAREANKIVNLPVLKHHQSAGVTIALKNMSHGFVNNVSRSHSTPTLNACGTFIPAVVNLPVIREKVVLHIVDGVKASYHGGPSARQQFVWEHKTMYFATDPVAVDKIGWRAIDAKRVASGMLPVADSKPDKVSTFLNCQVEHIEIAGALGLGEFDDKRIDHCRVKL